MLKLFVRRLKLNITMFKLFVTNTETKYNNVFENILQSHLLAQQKIIYITQERQGVVKIILVTV